MLTRIRSCQFATRRPVARARSNTRLLGIPNDTVSVFVWLWFGTIAWNIEAPWHYHLRFVRDWSLPMLGLIIYFYSRGALQLVILSHESPNLLEHSPSGFIGDSGFALNLFSGNSATC